MFRKWMEVLVAPTFSMYETRLDGLLKNGSFFLLRELDLNFKKMKGNKV